MGLRVRNTQMTKIFPTLILIVVINLYLPRFTCGDNVQDYLKYEDPSSCTQHHNRTFSSTSLGCVNCHQDKDKNKGYYSGCSCPVNHVMVFVHNEELQKGTRTKCVPCPENDVTYDQRSCIACANNTKPDEFTGSCGPCPSGHILSYKTIAGAPRKRVECVQCSDGFTPSPSGESCIPCHSSYPSATNGMCKCPEASHIVINGICFANGEMSDPPLDTSSLFKIEYDNGQRTDSPFLRDNLLSSFYLCKNQKNVSACQLLANMCTLLLHSHGSVTNACTLYRLITTDFYNIQPPYIPKLYYNIDASTLLIKASSIPTAFDMNLGDTTSDVNITVSRVTVDGIFQGLSLLNEIIPCSEPTRVQRYARKFGTTFKTSCKIPIQDLWNKYAHQMEFLDPYLSFKSDNEIKLYPIPVKIRNYKQGGDYINDKDDNHLWQLVRRFFFIDTVDNVETEERGEGTFKSSKLIRYLEKITIGIQLQNSPEPGKIYVPLITLWYNEMGVDAYRRNEPASFEFSVEYVMDMTRSLEDVKISVGVISSLTVLWAAMQAWSWNRRSGRPYIDIITIANLLIYTCGHLADAFFVVCFGTSMFWLFFYKNQAAVHVLLPQPEQERLIRDLLISSFSLKIVEVIQLIFRQVTVDIFFIDWERPKARRTIQSPSSVKSAGGSTTQMEDGGNNNQDKSEGSVSIWRTYFIANEWNEIQSTRKIHVAAQIIVTILLLEIVGLKNWGLMWPEGKVDPGPEYRSIAYSMSARFAVGSLVFLVIGSCQWIVRVGIIERFIANKIQDFVDVCTLANVSVFILAADQYGYYIHGRSVHGFSDTSMQTMIEQLSREEEDLCGRRGLLPSTDQQTFLISVPSSFRSVYNQVLQPLYASSNANLNIGKGRAQLGSLATKMQLNSSKPTSTMLSLSVHAYHSMNRFLTAFLEHALSDLDYDVTDKSFFEATFDMEFGVVTHDRAIFYTDNGHSFDSVLFYGNERTLFLFNLYTFVFTEILSHNFLLAGIVTYFSDMGLKYVRNYLGKRNLARKTLIDSRFLI